MDWESFFTHYRKPGFIPGYEIVNKLGSGVFGEVYKARKESIGKFYAIKFLKVSDEKVSEAIFKELDSLRYFAQIDHPNLVSIEDKGEVMGIPYIVMGYAGDETLKKLLQEGPIDGDRARAIFGQICAGVGALHEKSIIHFDLKPANIFMKSDHARVGDYGLSKLVSESHMTMSIGRGTPYYMAPEMLNRKGDHRSDIYSMGVILFEMVTGKVPFTGDSEWEVLRKHESEPVVIPESVGEPFRGLIARCMEKDAEKRFQSVAEILPWLESTTGPAVPIMPVEDSPAGPAVSPAPAPRPVPPPLPHRRPSSGKAKKARRELKRHVARVMPRIEAAGGKRAGQADPQVQVAVGELPLEESFFSDFEREAAEARPVAEARKPFFLFRPFIWMGRLIASFFHNFFRYAIVLAITAGLAVLIHLAMRGFVN